MMLQEHACIGRGRTAEIYAWADGQVLKLYRPGWDADRVTEEARITALAHDAGLPAPAIYGTLAVEGRQGILCERLDGAPIDRMVNLLRSARLLAEVQAAIHACRIPALPAQRERLMGRISRTSDLTPDRREAILHVLEGLPDDGVVCHGDLHPQNILLTARGPVIIDWVDTTRGHPLADVARTSILLGAWPEYDTNPALRILRRAAIAALHAIYLRRYCELRPEADRAQLAKWRGPVAAARLVEGIAEERDYLLGIVAANT
jgi:aminoglycoside phosphotransferase (APT) family kinase protein